MDAHPGLVFLLVAVAVVVVIVPPPGVLAAPEPPVLSDPLVTEAPPLRRGI